MITDTAINCNGWKDFFLNSIGQNSLVIAAFNLIIRNCQKRVDIWSSYIMQCFFNFFFLNNYQKTLQEFGPKSKLLYSALIHWFLDLGNVDFLTTFNTIMMSNCEKNDLTAAQGVKYFGVFSFRSLKTREKYISFTQLALLS